MTAPRPRTRKRPATVRRVADLTPEEVDAMKMAQLLGAYGGTFGAVDCEARQCDALSIADDACGVCHLARGMEAGQ